MRMGPMTLISHNTEMWTVKEHPTLLPKLFAWLRNRLRAARRSSQWVVVVSHTPMYTSGARKRKKFRNTKTKKISYQVNSHYDHFVTERRLGPFYHSSVPNKTEPYPFERLFHEEGVDLHISGHWHNYERFLPAFNSAPLPGPDPGDPYADPGGVVHIVAGNGGRGFEPFDDVPLRISEVRRPERGVGILKVNSKRLEWTMFHCDFQNCTGEVLDQVEITRKQPEGRRAEKDKEDEDEEVEEPAKPTAGEQQQCGGESQIFCDDAGLEKILRRRVLEIEAQVKRLRRDQRRLRRMLRRATEVKHDKNSSLKSS
eukprot:Hpha_TRINITY_DN15996_c1_g3::TRINITY_DN15996_c1_g3_i2::g.74456::m.74456